MYVAITPTRVWSSLQHAARTVAPSLAAALLLPALAFGQANVTTHHNDNARTGANLNETVLTTTNVNVSQFGKLFERIVDDEIYGQPLYVEGVSVPGVGIRNVVFVTTNSNSVYAFDADDPLATAPLWRTTYINPAAGIVPLVRNDVGQSCGTYADFAGNIGIGGTPVIDAAAGTMYFVTRTKENGIFTQRLHAIEIATGAERAGSPLLIQANVTGTGDGRDAQNNIAFNHRTQNQRAALLLDRGTVYIAWASYCDQGPYHGWILAYDATTLSQVMVYNTTPDGGLGGIWQSGGGLAADATGNIYGLTGNGSFNGDTGGRNFSNSFVKLSPAGTLLDWFTPFNWSFLNATDEDLGVQNALLIPNSNLVVGGGKEGVLYVLDRNAMGNFRSTDNNQIVQSFQASTSARMNGSPVFWNSPTYGPAIYLWPAGDPLKVFRLVGNTFITPATAQSTALASGGMPGGMMALSANGGTAGTGILWATLSTGGDANHNSRPGILRAYDAGNVTRELWNSSQNQARDTLGLFSKFSPPTVANGKVYVGSLQNKLVVYGLLPPSAGNAVPVVDAGADQAIPEPGTASLVGNATDDGLPNPPGTLTVAWSLISGPAAVTFATPTALITNATFTVPGSYTIRLSAFDGQATISDDVNVVVSAPAGSGTGLLAQYFNDAGSGVYFSSLALSRTDATINFNWAENAPDPAVQADNFSVRWSGQVQAPVSGSYTFTTTSDDGVRLWVNGQNLVDNWTEHAATANSGSITLAAGQRYDIRMDFFDRASLAQAQLAWTYPGQNSQIVPQFALYPAPPVNLPPAVSAGPDLTVTLPASATLNGMAKDDGLPSVAAFTATWTKVSGREDSDGGTVTFGNLHAAVTTVTFGAPGTYVLRLAANDSAVTVSDDVTVTVLPPPVIGTGSGLVGTYYKDLTNGTHFATQVVTRVDPTVNFDWVNAAPVAGVTADYFSVRWVGQVQAPISGNYLFYTTADDGVRLWVNNVLLIDNWVNQSATTKTSVPVALVSGVKYAIKMEYYERTSTAVAKLLWSYTNQAQQPIPTTQLYGPLNNAPTANAGVDQTVASGTANLVGTATDDGMPNPPAALTYAWSTVSGPGTVAFTAGSSATTQATFSAAGTYVLRLTVSDSQLSATDDVQVVVSSAAAHGLTAQYYNDPTSGNTHLSNLITTRVDTTVNFTWAGSPASGVTADNFSVRWTGQIEAPVSGNFRFATVSDDGVRLWVNGNLVIDNWTDHGSTTNQSGTIALVAGQRYAVRMEFYDRAGNGIAKLQWSYPGRSTIVIPTERLFQ